MSLLARDSAAGRTGQQIQASENETPRSSPTQVQPSTANAKTFSITRRVIMAVVAGEMLLAAGLVLVATVYANTQVAIYAGSAGLVVLLAGSLFTIRTIRRGLDPLRELAERAGAISVKNWNFNVSPGDGLAEELSPLVAAVDKALLRVQSAFRQQRDFASDAAHELKTSVAIVKSTLQLLLQRPRTQREYEIGLEGLLEDCGRLEDLLERMLRLARIEQLRENGVRPNTATADLTSTCEAALARIHTLAEERNVALDFQASASISLLADPEDLELIWMNLLENAVKNSPPGSTVTMRASLSAKSMAQISVLDSGPGIPPADLPHIFERFHRGASSPERPTGGFGLGLAICKALVDAYGGTIEALNIPEHGAAFRVQLPVRQR
jgi:signal transduction histidine kinase